LATQNDTDEIPFPWDAIRQMYFEEEEANNIRRIIEIMNRLFGKEDTEVGLREIDPDSKKGIPLRYSESKLRYRIRKLTRNDRKYLTLRARINHEEGYTEVKIYDQDMGGSAFWVPLTWLEFYEKLQKTDCPRREI